jgi:hypothetical protein
MKTWTHGELNQIGAAEELEIAPVGRDGTLRRAVTIWVVRFGDDLYVRSAYGRVLDYDAGAPHDLINFHGPMGWPAPSIDLELMRRYVAGTPTQSASVR